MKYVLFLMMILFSGQALALNCAQAPSCEELGYSTEDNLNCLADGYLICPFDSNYKKCVNFDCESLGFTKDDKNSWCNEIVSCKEDTSYTLCNCLKPRCQIGDVLYADGSCGAVNEDATGKVAVGVVFTTNCDGGGKAVALKDLAAQEIRWGLYDYGQISGLTNYYDDVIALLDLESDIYNGQKNTDILVKTTKQNCAYQVSDGNYNTYCIAYAAQLTRAYVPTEVSESNT